MLSTPKSNAKRNGEKKNMKGEGKLKKESLKRRPPSLFLFSVRDAAAYSCSDLLKSNKEKDIVFLKKRSFVSFFVPSFVFLAPFCLVERQ